MNEEVKQAKKKMTNNKTRETTLWKKGLTIELLIPVSIPLFHPQ